MKHANRLAYASSDTEPFAEAWVGHRLDALKTHALVEVTRSLVLEKPPQASLNLNSHAHVH